MESSASDLVPPDHTGIAHIDMTVYETGITEANHAGDSLELRIWRSAPGGPANSPIDMEVIHPYKKVVEYGGRYGPEHSLILFWACHLPCQFSPSYSFILEHLFR